MLREAIITRAATRRLSTASFDGGILNPTGSQRTWDGKRKKSKNKRDVTEVVQPSVWEARKFLCFSL